MGMIDFQSRRTNVWKLKDPEARTETGLAVEQKEKAIQISLNGLY